MGTRLGKPREIAPSKAAHKTIYSLSSGENPGSLVVSETVK
jgi:hypothetical protein